MGGGKLTRLVGTLFLVFGVTLMCAFWWARSTGHGELGVFFGKGLRYLMYAMLACVAYMGLVGAYHTFLAVFGLDGEPGLFSSGRRTGPMSGSGEEAAAREEAPESDAGSQAPPASLN